MKKLDLKSTLERISGVTFDRRHLDAIDRTCWFARLEDSPKAIALAEKLAPEIEECGALIYAGKSAPTIMVTIDMLNASVNGGPPLPSSEWWREVVVVPDVAMPDALGLFEVEGFPDSLRSDVAHRREEIAEEMRDLANRIHTSIGPIRLIALCSSCATFGFCKQIAVSDRQLAVDMALEINGRYFPKGPSPRSAGKYWVKSGVFGFGPT
ncbi:MAG: hypothetical protein JNM99_22640 [Verrucomicrobiaceae bacterium]|nr:hypothetical protein [Verrucomicrobiaceae bacterium]